MLFVQFHLNGLPVSTVERIVPRNKKEPAEADSHFWG